MVITQHEYFTFCIKYIITVEDKGWHKPWLKTFRLHMSCYPRFIYKSSRMCTLICTSEIIFKTINEIYFSFNSLYQTSIGTFLKISKIDKMTFRSFCLVNCQTQELIRSMPVAVFKCLIVIVTFCLWYHAKIQATQPRSQKKITALHRSHSSLGTSVSKQVYANINYFRSFIKEELPELPETLTKDVNKGIDEGVGRIRYCNCMSIYHVHEFYIP